MDSCAASRPSTVPCSCPCAPINAGPALDVPHSVTPQQLEVLLNGLLQNDEKLPYSFYIEGQVCALAYCNRTSQALCTTPALPTAVVAGRVRFLSLRLLTCLSIYQCAARSSIRNRVESIISPCKDYSNSSRNNHAGRQPLLRAVRLLPEGIEVSFGAAINPGVRSNPSRSGSGIGTSQLHALQLTVTSDTYNHQA